MSTRLVATPLRWMICTVAVSAVFLLLTAGALAFMHSSRPLDSLVWVFGGFAALVAILMVFLLRAEESRLARDLRTARTGTPALRAMVAHRREQVPFFARPCATGLGVAAVRLADGDRTGALESLARGSPLMRGGRLDGLRALVEADAARATHAPASLDAVIRQLRAAPSLGHREADRYRVHVLVKAILERGDSDAGAELARELQGSTDEEQALYATWLRVWFELDAEDEAGEWPPIAEPQARLATLAARAHGAEQLVDKLEARLLAIAHPEEQG